ncbi:lmo1851 family serine protease [Paenisporosarcina antarctica]|uniref:PDZ domain-containing protein n=1 Tax=Paenisporosarcina antarctica TaxID=417367 RepID=A0A4P6ZYL2_9BACL|nr:S41 family peptidase [Paenisporosarcina antarctica]QBP41179.1 PDZ domain-containing protein [Paenisporosarcina antarctica]
MDEKQNTPEQQVEHNHQDSHAGKYIRLKPFFFIMLIFTLILSSAGLTIFALTFGDEKVVEVGAPERREFQKLYQAYDQLKADYYADIDQELLVNGAINGMIDSLGDPYSDYMNQDEASQFKESISSSFQGIGAEIQERNGVISVVSPIKNSPAEKAGILTNDSITAVDGEDIIGMSASEAVLLIRGEKGTSVTLTIQRGEQSDPMEITIVRDEIPIETVYAEMLEDNVAHIQITSFSENTYDELLAAITDMEESGMKAMVLDVRRNPGGLLNSAINISNLFVEDGKTLFQTKEKGKDAEVFSATGGSKVKVPVSLLIDEGSASASEILAAAMRESAGTQLVGINTFGKGTVQTANELTDGSNMKFTTAKWLTPDGNWIHEKGIAPDVKVEYPSYTKLPFLDASIEIKNGLLSDQVKSAEEMLTAVGIDTGKVDGLFDDQTEAAIKQLQKEEELKETGILTGDTTYALMDRLREKIEKEDPQLLKAKDLILKVLAK